MVFEASAPSVAGVLEQCKANGEALGLWFVSPPVLSWWEHSSCPVRRSSKFSRSRGSGYEDLGETRWSCVRVSGNVHSKDLS